MKINFHKLCNFLNILPYYYITPLHIDPIRLYHYCSLYQITIPGYFTNHYSTYNHLTL